MSYKVDIRKFRYCNISSAQGCFYALSTEEIERLWIDLLLKRKYLWLRVIQIGYYGSFLSWDDRLGSVE